MFNWFKRKKEYKMHVLFFNKDANNIEYITSITIESKTEKHAINSAMSYLNEKYSKSLNGLYIVTDKKLKKWKLKD